MAQSEKDKIAAAKAAGKNISDTTYSKTSKQGAPTKADKIIKAEAARGKDEGRKTGATSSTIKVPGNPTVGQARTATETKAENALSKAAAVAAKTGEMYKTFVHELKQM